VYGFYQEDIDWRVMENEVQNVSNRDVYDDQFTVPSRLFMPYEYSDEDTVRNESRQINGRQ
jgi:hypothetical protein